MARFERGPSARGAELRAHAQRLARRALPHTWLLAILGIAVWLRFAGLGNEHLYGDEAEYAIVARHLARDLLDLRYPEIAGMEGLPFVSQPPLVLYLMALSMKAFGPTDFAALLPSVLLGIGTVAVVYAIGLRLGGRLQAVVAATLLAVLPFHVEMSRSAMLDAPYAFFLALTAFFLVAWLQDRRAPHALGAGLAAAGAALSKLPGVLAALIVGGVFLAVLAAAAIQWARRRADAAHVRRVAGAAGLAFAPLALGALGYLALLGHVGALDALRAKLEWQLGRVSGGSSGRPMSFYFDDPHSSFRALLGGGVVGLALAGAGFGLVRWTRRPLARADHLVVPLFTAVLAWFFLTSARKEGFYLLPFAPFAALLVGGTATGVRDMIDWAGIRFTPRLAPRVGPAAMAVAVAVIAMPAYGALSESYEDFGPDADGSTFGYGTREAAQWIRAQDPDAGQYGTLLGRFTLLWYNEQPSYHWFVGEDALREAIESGELRYIVFDEYLGLKHDTKLMHSLIAEYEGVEVASFVRDWGVVRVYELGTEPSGDSQPCPWMGKRSHASFAC